MGAYHHPGSVQRFGRSQILRRRNRDLRGEREALLDLRVKWVDLPNRIVVNTTVAKRDKVRDMRENLRLSSALSRMEDLIRGRLGPSHMVWETRPMRNLPPGVDLVFLLYDKLVEQDNLCALCRTPMRLDATKKLLQMSPDRKDSTNPSYSTQSAAHSFSLQSCEKRRNDAGFRGMAESRGWQFKST
jgi:hypothetical protein